MTCGHARKVHLDQRLFDGGLPTPVASGFLGSKLGQILAVGG
jgi:hypothetical protein